MYKQSVQKSNKKRCYLLYTYRNITFKVLSNSVLRFKYCDLRQEMDKERVNYNFGQINCIPPVLLLSPVNFPSITTELQLVPSNLRV